MTFLKTIAEDINAFTRCSQTWPSYLQCFFHTWCAYEDTQLLWGLLPNQPWEIQTEAWHRAPDRAAASCTDPAGNMCGTHGVLAPTTTDLLIQRGVPLRGKYQHLQMGLSLCFPPLLGARQPHRKPCFLPSVERGIWGGGKMVSALIEWL